MQANYTHITVILDRTGSMESIRDDTIGGFNTFLGDQQALPEKATLTLVQFDSQDPYEVIHHFRDLPTVPQLTRETFVPRSMTPLFDAIGRGINDLETSLAKLPDALKPSKVVVVIITDGQENASQEFDLPTISRMIAEKQATDWQFVFLSADLSALNEALNTGVKPAAAMAFDKNQRGAGAAWESLSKKLASYRVAESPEMEFEFDDSDRALQDIEKLRKKIDDLEE